MAQNVYRPDSSTGKDSWMNDDSPDTNYGNTTGQLVGVYEDGKDLKNFRFIIDFDISDILGATIADTSKLGIWAYDFSGTPSDYVFEYRRITQAAWTEAGVTWNKYDGSNTWTSGGGDYTTPTFNGNGPSVDGAMWELTGAGLQAFLQDAIDSRSGIVRLLLKRQLENGVDTHFFALPCEWGSPAERRPTLTVDYTPAAAARRIFIC